MRLSVAALVVVTALTSCQKDEAAGRARLQSFGYPSLFDDVLARPDVMTRVRSAEADLPGDEHRSVGGLKPRQWNQSRELREIALAHELAEEVRPRLASMTVRQLIEAIKLYPDWHDCPQGVAYWLYGEGNQMIVGELRLRPPSQLGELRRLVDDRREIFRNETISDPLGKVCREILDEKPKPGHDG